MPKPKKLADAEPLAAAPYTTLAPSTNASPARTMFVMTVAGSVILPQRGSVPSLVVELGVVEDGAEEGDVVPVPLAPESLVRVMVSLEP